MPSPAEPKNNDAAEYGRVLRFERPGAVLRKHHPLPAAPAASGHARGLAPGLASGLASASPVEDLNRFAQAPGDTDDYRHRQIANVAALGVCVLLVVTGVWLADKIAQLRRDQDCVLAGRRNCAQISIVNTVGGSAALPTGRERLASPHN